MRQFERLDDQLGFGALLGGPLLDLDEQPRLTFDQLLVKALVAVASDLAREVQTDEAILLACHSAEILAQRRTMQGRRFLVRAGASG